MILLALHAFSGKSSNVLHRLSFAQNVRQAAPRRLELRALALDAGRVRIIRNVRPSQTLNPARTMHAESVTAGADTIKIPVEGKAHVARFSILIPDLLFHGVHPCEAAVSRRFKSSTRAFSASISSSSAMARAKASSQSDFM